MDRLNFVEDGAIKLPPGFRFQPTDEEIVFQYLMRKIFSLPLPASVVPEFTVSKYDPWDFPGDDEEQDIYFFAKKEAKYQNGNRINRATSSGYWKSTGTDKRITCPRRKDIMGMRKTLVFNRGKPPTGIRTDWIMHEYRLVNFETTTSNSKPKNSNQNNLIEMGNWVFCRMFLRRRSVENNENMLQVGDEERVESVDQPRVEQYYDSGPSSSSTSSCGSSIITSSGFDDEENSGLRWL